jgi:hypothetical protein
MRAATVLLAGAAAFSLSATALAQERHYDVTVRPVGGHHDAVQKIRVSKAAIGDSPIVIWGGAAIDPDCTAHPGYTLSVVQPPAHGQVKVVEEGVYLAFPPNNPRAACNSHKVPGRQAYYTANPGYSGRDRIVLEGVTEDGTIRHVTVDVDLRKAG